jgi:hypothetical protein
VAKHAPKHTFLGNDEEGYERDCRETMIQVTTRFPLVQDSPVKLLSLPLGLKNEDHFTEVSSIIKPSPDDIEKIRLHESDVRARVLDISDPIVEAAVSYTYDKGLSCCHGDLYAFSTWKMHQINSSRSRGMMDPVADPDGFEVIADSGIFLTPRIKFAKAQEAIDNFEKAPFKPRRPIEGLHNNIGDTAALEEKQKAPERYVNSRISQQNRNTKHLSEAMDSKATSASAKRSFSHGKSTERIVSQRPNPAVPVGVRAGSSSAGNSAADGCE